MTTTEEIVAMLDHRAQPKFKDPDEELFRLASQRLKEQAEEIERLRLEMLGGEDAPGYAASLTLDQVLDSYRDHQSFLKFIASRDASRIAKLEEALRPFAAIKPSSFYARDGSEGDGYRASLADSDTPGDGLCDFTGKDLARARSLLSEGSER